MENLLVQLEFSDQLPQRRYPAREARLNLLDGVPDHGLPEPRLPRVLPLCETQAEIGAHLIDEAFLGDRSLVISPRTREEQYYIAEMVWFSAGIQADLTGNNRRCTLAVAGCYCEVIAGTGMWLGE